MRGILNHHAPWDFWALSARPSGGHSMGLKWYPRDSILMELLTDEGVGTMITG